MKRVMIWIIVLALAGAWIAASRQGKSSPPRFVSWPEGSNCQAATGWFVCEQNNRRIDDGTLWLYGQFGLTTKLLYDLDKKKPLGYVTNGDPVVRFQNQLLCVQQDERRPWVQNAADGLRKYSLGRILIPPPMGRYWLVDTAQNTAQYLGEKPGYVGAYEYYPSPDFQRGYFFRIFSKGYFLDLPGRRLRNWKPKDLPLGWWDNTNILSLTTNQNVALCDPATGTAKTLVEAAQIRRFLLAHHIPNPTGNLGIVSYWNGKEMEFFLSEDLGGGRDSFLIHIRRLDGQLELQVPHFQFENRGRMDPSGHYYVYNDDSSGHFRGRLMARNLDTGANHILAPGNALDPCFFSFHNGYVFYSEDKKLWRTKLDGSAREQWFPSPN